MDTINSNFTDIPRNYQFIGDDHKEWGIKKGNVYKIILDHAEGEAVRASVDTSLRVEFIPYKSLEAFYKNWLIVKKKI